MKPSQLCGNGWGKNLCPFSSLSGILAVIGSAAIVLPLAVSRVYYLGMAGLALIFFVLMLPTVNFVERFQESHSLWIYSLGFLLTFLLAFAAVGFLSGVIQTTLNLILFTGGLTSGWKCRSDTFSSAARRTPSVADF